MVWTRVSFKIFIMLNRMNCVEFDIMSLDQWEETGFKDNSSFCFWIGCEIRVQQTVQFASVALTLCCQITIFRANSKLSSTCNFFNFKQLTIVLFIFYFFLFLAKCLEIISWLLLEGNVTFKNNKAC